MQKSLGKLETAVENLAEQSKEQKKELDRVSKVIYAATAIVTIAVVVGGFLVNTAKDVFVQYMQQHPPTASQPSQSK